MNRKEYNGWTNYETWVVALWMDNERGSQDYWNERTAEVIAEHGESLEGRAIVELSEILKDYHEEAIPEVAGFAADLLGAAMSEVDWYEIARHYVEAVNAEKEAK
jgi:hypothetical protein